MFDTTKEFDITIYSGGPKKCVVAWPSDADWKLRARRIRIKNESAGREKTKSSVIGAEPAALEMFEKIRRDTGDPFDAAEALEVIDRLEYCELSDGEDGDPAIQLRDGIIEVRMACLKSKGRAAMNGIVHRLKQPFMSQIRSYKRGCIVVEGVRKGTEMTQPLAPGEAFYDELAVIGTKAEGYAEAIPVIHKDFVVCRVLDFLRELEEGGADDEDGDSDE